MYDTDLVDVSRIPSVLIAEAERTRPGRKKKARGQPRDDLFFPCSTPLFLTHSTLDLACSFLSCLFPICLLTVNRLLSLPAHDFGQLPIDSSCPAHDPSLIAMPPPEGAQVDLGKAQVVDRAPKVIKELKFGVLYGPHGEIQKDSPNLWRP